MQVFIRNITVKNNPTVKGSVNNEFKISRKEVRNQTEDDIEVGTGRILIEHELVKNRAKAPKRIFPHITLDRTTFGMPSLICVEFLVPLSQVASIVNDHLIRIQGTTGEDIQSLTPDMLILGRTRK